MQLSPPCTCGQSRPASPVSSARHPPRERALGGEQHHPTARQLLAVPAEEVEARPARSPGSQSVRAPVRTARDTAVFKGSNYNMHGRNIGCNAA